MALPRSSLLVVKTNLHNMAQKVRLISLFVVAASALPEAYAFGPFKHKCNTFFTQSSCLSNTHTCRWCNSTDVDSQGNPYDELCFSIGSANKLNTTDWTCSTNDRIERDSAAARPPAEAYFSLFQQSDAKHCVELDVDSEVSKNASCFQKFWAGMFLTNLLNLMIHNFFPKLDKTRLNCLVYRLIF